MLFLWLLPWKVFPIPSVMSAIAVSVSYTSYRKIDPQRAFLTETALRDKGQWRNADAPQVSLLLEGYAGSGWRIANVVSPRDGVGMISESRIKPY